MTTTIRPARPSELRLLAAIEDAGVPLFRDHFGAGVVPALVAPAPSGNERDQVGTLLVALVATDEGSEVVGFAHVLPYDAHAHLEQLSVLPAHGRRGIGAALVRAAMEEARWAGHEVMSLTTYRDVPWNAPFYARLGFAEVTDPEPFQRRLREHEVALGLDEPGARVVMEVPLRRITAR